MTQKNSKLNSKYLYRPLIIGSIDDLQDEVSYRKRGGIMNGVDLEKLETNYGINNYTIVRYDVVNSKLLREMYE